MVRKSGMLAEPVGEPVDTALGARILLGYDAASRQVHLVTETAAAEGADRMAFGAILTMPEVAELLDRFSQLATKVGG